MTDYDRFNADFAAFREAIEKSKIEGWKHPVTIPFELAVRLEDDIYEMDRHLPDFFDSEYDPDAPEEEE